MLGTHTFGVTDSARATATGTVLGDGHQPASAQPQGLPDRREPTELLSGPAFNGQALTGKALADETQFSCCGGFSTVSICVKKVNLPGGTQAVGHPRRPAGRRDHAQSQLHRMATCNLGDFAPSMEQAHVYSSFPDVGSFQQILSGGSFG